MDIVSLIGRSMGSAWLSGVNLYATVAVLGLLGRFGAIQLPGELNVLTNKWVLGIAVGMYVVEFFADKIPYLDSIWDVIHTFIHIPAASAAPAGMPMKVWIKSQILSRQGILSAKNSQTYI